MSHKRGWIRVNTAVLDHPTPHLAPFSEFLSQCRKIQETRDGDVAVLVLEHEGFSEVQEDTTDLDKLPLYAVYLGRSVVVLREVVMWGMANVTVSGPPEDLELNYQSWPVISPEA